MMHRGVALAAVVAAAMFSAACGGRAAVERTSTPTSSASTATTPPPAGAACASAVRDEFTRQQALVAWDVYCPSYLPDGVRLAHAGDPRPVPYLHQDYTPTVDDLNSGGGTFVTRMTGPDGKNLFLTQGAGNDVFNRRLPDGRLEARAGSAAFGDLQGGLFTAEPPAVIAGDQVSVGYRLEGTGMTPREVGAVAAAMRPVDPSGPHRALLTPFDLRSGGDWIVMWAPDPTGEDVASPVVCSAAVDAVPRAATAVARFEARPAGPIPKSYETPAPGAPADAAGHGPFLQEAVIRFESNAGAAAYLDRVRHAAASCAPYSPSEGVTVTVTPLDAPGLGDASVAFRRSLRSPVQGADADVAMIRVGELLAVLLHWQTVPAGGTAAAVALSPYAQLAAARLRQLAVPTK